MNSLENILKYKNLDILSLNYCCFLIINLVNGQNDKFFDSQKKEKIRKAAVAFKNLTQSEHE